MGIDDLSVFQAVFESTADGLLLVDNEGKVLASNSRFQELWKIPDSLMEKKNDELLLKFIVDQLIDPQSFISKVEELYRNETSISEDTIYFKDGRTFMRFSRPLICQEKNAGRIWSFRNITSQRKSEEMVEAITELSPDIISVISPEGVLIFNSPAAEKIHGYKNEDLIGKNTFDLIHGDDRATVSEAMAVLLSQPGGTASVQYRYLNKDGSYAWMEATASNQIRNPLIRGIVSISREIGKRKMLEQELSSALRLRDDFISIVTHELKTPVTSIKLQLQIIQRLGKNLNPEDCVHRSENLPALLGQVNSLERLIDDLLHVSRIKNGNLNFELKKENFSALMESSLERYRKMLLAADCELTIDLEKGISVDCDAMRVDQVLTNLVTNVIRYAPHKPVEISLHRNNDMAEIIFHDHGPGISPEKQNEIFQLFSRGEEFRNIGGLGVGLYISRNIIEQHGGTLRVNSASGKGAEFILRLPLSR